MGFPKVCGVFGSDSLLLHPAFEKFVPAVNGLFRVCGWKKTWDFLEVAGEGVGVERRVNLPRRA
jgi:hypothetical protein